MPISDFLFANTHRVEQLVGINRNRKVDMVLLKTIKVIRAVKRIDGWVKPSASMIKDLNLTPREMATVLKRLSEYYQVDLGGKTFETPNAIANAIHLQKPRQTDQFCLVNTSDMVTDDDNEVQPDAETPDPNVMVPRPVSEPIAPEAPAATEPVSDPQPPADPTLPPDPTIGEEPGNTELQTPEEQKAAEDPDATVSTEGLFSWLFGKRKDEIKNINPKDKEKLLKIQAFLLQKLKKSTIGSTKIKCQSGRKIAAFAKAHIQPLTEAIALVKRSASADSKHIVEEIVRIAKSLNLEKIWQDYPTVLTETVSLFDSGYLDLSLTKTAMELGDKYSDLAWDFRELCQKVSISDEVKKALSETKFYKYYSAPIVETEYTLAEDVIPILMRASNTSLKDLQEIITGRKSSSENFSTESLETTLPDQSSSWGSVFNKL